MELHQTFNEEKYAISRLPKTTEIIIVGFNIFRFVPPPQLMLCWRRPWWSHHSVSKNQIFAAEFLIRLGRS